MFSSSSCKIYSLSFFFTFCIVKLLFADRGHPESMSGQSCCGGMYIVSNPNCISKKEADDTKQVV
jgi:hypothetical protein